MGKNITIGTLPACPFCSSNRVHQTVYTNIKCKEYICDQCSKKFFVEPKVSIEYLVHKTEDLI